MIAAAGTGVEHRDGIHSVGRVLAELRDQMLRQFVVFRGAGGADAPHFERLAVQKEPVSLRRQFPANEFHDELRSSIRIGVASIAAPPLHRALQGGSPASMRSAVFFAWCLWLDALFG